MRRSRVLPFAFTKGTAAAVSGSAGYGVPRVLAVDGFNNLWTRVALGDETSGGSVANGSLSVASDGLDQENIPPFPNRLMTIARLTAYDAIADDYSNLRQYDDGSDNVATNAQGVLAVASRLFGWDGATYDRLRSGANNADGIAALALGLLQTLATIGLYNGATLDRARSGSAANLAAFSTIGAQLVSPPGQWSAFQTPAVSTISTVTRAAAGAGVRNVCNSIAFSMGGPAIQTNLTVVLRDGATGAGAILWSMHTAGQPANGGQVFEISGLNIPGTANTAMTLEFTAAPVATNFESVAMTGCVA